MTSEQEQGFKDGYTYGVEQAIQAHEGLLTVATAILGPWLGQAAERGEQAQGQRELREAHRHSLSPYSDSSAGILREKGHLGLRRVE